MTQPTPNLRETKRQQAQARKTATKTTATVTPLPVAAKAPAKKAPAKKSPAEKAAPEKAPKTASTRVAPRPRDRWKLGTPAKLTWETKEFKGVERQVATGARHLYRISLGDHGFVAEQKLHAGSWSQMGGRCATVEDAKTLAGWNESGCTWLAYRDVVGTEFAALVETYGAAK
jgi:hypothetical protein